MKCPSCNNNLKLQFEPVWEGRSTEGFYHCPDCDFRKSIGIWEHSYEERILRK